MQDLYQVGGADWQEQQHPDPGYDGFQGGYDQGGYPRYEQGYDQQHAGHPQAGPERRPGMAAGVIAGLAAVALVAVAGVFGYLWWSGNLGGSGSVAAPESSAATGDSSGGRQPGDDARNSGSGASSDSDDGRSTRGSSRSQGSGEDGDSGELLPPAEAEAALDGRRSATLETVELDGRWVLQLASKYPGVTDPNQTTVAGSHTFELPDIEREHSDLRDLMAADGVPVLLLRASDFGSSSSSRRNQLWVTLADPGGLSSQDAARSRCAELFPGRSGDALKNVCVPRRLNPPS